MLCSGKKKRLLNRIVEWTRDGITIEADQRHAEICIKEANLQESSREVTTPVDRSGKLEKESQNLEPKVATRYRGVVARLNYLGQDRSDIQQGVKELGKEMSNPNQNSCYVKMPNDTKSKVNEDKT